MMKNSFCEVPFYQEETRRFMPLIFAFLMAFLMIFNFLSSSITSHFKNLEQNALRFIIEVPNDNVETISNYLKTIDLIESSKVLEQDYVYHLLSYWIPDSELLSDLPFPVFIDIQLKKPIDVQSLELKLKSINKEIKINDFSKWDQSFFKTSRSIQKILIVFCISIFVSISILVSLISKSSISFHKSLLNNLRLIGVKSSKIAFLFQTQAFFVVFIGWIIGLILFISIMFIMSKSFISLPIQPFIDLKTFFISIIPSIFTCFFASLVSRITVLKYLANLEKN